MGIEAHLAEMAGEHFDDVAVDLREVRRARDRTELLVDLVYGLDGSPSGGTVDSRWLVVAEDTVAVAVRPGVHGTLLRPTAHPLLLPYREQRQGLYLTPSQEVDAEALLGDLFACQYKIVDDWFGLTEFLNVAFVKQPGLLKKSGLVARGPATLIAGFAEVLQTHGSYGGVLDEHGPVRWRHGRWEPVPAVQLLIMPSLLDEGCASWVGAANIHISLVESG